MTKKQKKMAMWAAGIAGVLMLMKKKDDGLFAWDDKNYNNGLDNGKISDWKGFFSFTPDAGGWYTPDSWTNYDGSRMTQTDFLAAAVPGVTSSDMKAWLSGSPVEPSGYTAKDKQMIEQLWDTPADFKKS